MSSSKLSILLMAFNSILKTNTPSSKNGKTKTTTSDSKDRPSNTTGNMSLIAEGTVIEGKVNFAQNARIDGTIQGEVFCDNKLVMGPKSKLKGTLKANNSTIEGTVEGDVKVTDTLHLAQSARITGEIMAKKLRVDSGALLNGDFKVG